MNCWAATAANSSATVDFKRQKGDVCIGSCHSYLCLWMSKPIQKGLGRRIYFQARVQEASCGRGRSLCPHPHNEEHAMRQPNQGWFPLRNRSLEADVSNLSVLTMNLCDLVTICEIQTGLLFIPDETKAPRWSSLFPHKSSSRGHSSPREFIGS